MGPVESGPRSDEVQIILRKKVPHWSHFGPRAFGSVPRESRRFQLRSQETKTDQFEPIWAICKTVYHGDIADEQSSLQASPTASTAAEHAPEAAAETAVDAAEATEEPLRRVHAEQQQQGRHQEGQVLSGGRACAAAGQQWLSTPPTTAAAATT